MGAWEYLMVGDSLHRASLQRPVVAGFRSSELWVGAPVEFALRVLRLQAGLPEREKR